MERGGGAAADVRSRAQAERYAADFGKAGSGGNAGLARSGFLKGCEKGLMHGGGAGAGTGNPEEEKLSLGPVPRSTPREY